MYPDLAGCQSLTDDPQTPDDILSLVTPASNGSSLNAVVLLSKSLAAWLAFDDSFLTKFVGRIAPPSCSHLTLLAAVVDRLPSPGAQWARTSTEDPMPLRKDHGLEGLAYYASPSQNIFANLTPNEGAGPITASSSRPDVATASESPPCISFDLYDQVSAGAKHPSKHTSITLPLSNTVFQTGQPATALFSEWSKAHSDNWILSSKADIAYDNHAVSLYANAFNRVNRRLLVDASDKAFHAHLAMPLDPLVPARRIENAKGNIITKVSDVGSDDGVRPASKELEGSVSQYFSERNIDPSVMAVWSLIIPEALAKSHAHLVAAAQQTWLAERSEDGIRLSNQYIAALLWSGACLRKVLSGGGGWGQKAGLLSIDPESDYVSKKPTIPSFLESMSNEEGMPYPDITLPGDLIAFFAAPESADMFATGQNVVSLGADASTLDFGVVPSTMDGDRYAEEGAQKGDTDYEVFPEHFGALSEGGMSVTSRNGSTEAGVHTKVDVPFTRFSVVEEQS